MKVRRLAEQDFEKVLKLNNANTPAVSEINMEELQWLVNQSLHSLVVEDSNNLLVGFCIILPPAINYKSDNYRWISEKYGDFEYLDRVVIAEEFRGLGCGRDLYQHWFEKAQAKNLILEVNIRPMNESSILFHEKLGFKVVGEQDTEGGKKRVQYMRFTR
ncbi:MAG: GNAT family N-acetyltransferase [Oligoflexia bacterium]|nr:GNAT family N-acetyltransferase [Oligoflexia bacterium]